MSKKNILIVNWGIDTGEFPLRESIRLGKYNIYLACTKKPPVWVRKLFNKSRIIETNPYNSQTLIQDVEEYSLKRKIKFDIVTTFFEMNVYQTAVLANYLDCRTYLPPAIALRTSVNKLLMRNCINKTKIRQPRYLGFSINQLGKAYQFYLRLNKAAVIKPVHSGHSYGSRYIEKGRSKIEFLRLVQEASDELKIVFDEWMEYEHDFDQQYLIEEYVEGKMVSFDGVVKRVGQVQFIGSLEFDLMPKPLLQQIGHTSPVVSLSWVQERECKKYVKRVVKAIGLEYCGFHCELKIENGKVFLIEVAGRLPGGVVLETYQIVSKTNIIDQFFSTFEDGARKYIVKNRHFYKNETRIGVYDFSESGKVSKVFIPKEIETDRKIISKIYSVREGERFVKDKKNYAKLMVLLKMSSTDLSTKELLVKRNEYLKQIKIEVENSWMIKSKNECKKLINNFKSRLRRI